MYDDGLCDETKVFEGTLEECQTYLEDDEYDDCFIVEPDGFTVYEG